MSDNRYTQAFADQYEDGLSKLEYAAIHIFAACWAAGPEDSWPSPKGIIDLANELFDELDKQ